MDRLPAVSCSWELKHERRVLGIAALAVAEPRRPLAGAFGEESEQMPERAEIVARMEARVRHAQDAAVLAPEHGDARHPSAVVRLIAHVGREARAPVTHHGEAPA